MNLFRRLGMFIRDYCDEFGTAWSIARMRDCERNGGHRWGAPHDDEVLGHAKTCQRCGCGEAVQRTTITINPMLTTGTGDVISPMRWAETNRSGH